MSSLGKCFICEGQLSEGVTREVKEKGVKTLIDYSIKWKDGKQSQLEGLKSVKVHEKCRKVYTKERSAEAFQSRQETSPMPTTSLRSLVSDFDFLHGCLFCGEDASDEFLKKQSKKLSSERESVHRVETLHVKDTILKAGEKRNDDWGKTVCTRICNVVDLVAAEARYHSTCMKKFYQTSSGMKRGRPKSSSVLEAMTHAFNYLEENREECQFTLSEIFEGYEGEVPTEKTIKSELKEKYGQDIVVSVNKNRKPVVCFRDTGNKILTDAWYERQSNDEKEERLRIVKTAAKIIAEDIRSQMYQTDQYPPPENFLTDLDSVIPDTLNYLVKTIVLKNKKGDKSKWDKKCTAISHAILTAARPNSFISPLQIGLAVHLSQKYGSKHLLNVLSTLGLCASYAEAALFQVSALQHPARELQTYSFTQFVFDNADVNICTIDGFNTFHSMGGIQCVTPSPNDPTSDQPITRLEKIPCASSVGQFGRVPIKAFENKSSGELLHIKVRDLANINPISTTVSVTTTELLWLLGKWQMKTECPGWNGYMETCTAHLPYDVSQISYLPFTNARPTDYDTIYTVLDQAVEKCKEMKHQSCFVTFDQPLYIKARDIVAKCGQDSHLSNVIVCLGGFHLLMSFMGGIGYIMNGSGIKTLFSTVYASASVDKMLNGHAYARALRAHILAHVALATLILNETDLSPDERSTTEAALREIDSTLIDNEVLQNVLCKFNGTLSLMKSKGATANLWVQYFEMVTLVKQFIEAERSGNWKLHLETIQKMLPYFHASGHFLYAKSAQLYLQDMFDLKDCITPKEFEDYIQKGFFTIRRSEKFWSGIWSDMTIEQTLMRFMKSSGGLTHGRGMTDSMLTKWVLGMPINLRVTEKIEEYCDVTYSTGEQHVDARKARISRDNQDLQHFVEGFSSHPPFPDFDGIMSIRTGVTGDVETNPHNAYDVGVCSMSNIVGNNLAKVKFERKKRVKPLGAAMTRVKIRDVECPVEPEMLFRRISFTKNSQELFKLNFEYELAPYPMSLFNELGMRKTKKSMMYEVFAPLDTGIVGDTVYVVDGGFLIHRVVWQKGDIFSAILNRYTEYVKKHYKGNAIVVFDGYPENLAEKSTKCAERACRMIYSTRDTMFDETMPATTSQSKFLSNERNKSRLITMLITRLINEGFTVKQATEDADTLIVNTAIEESTKAESVTIVGEDVDLLIILTALGGSKTNINILKQGKGNTESKLYTPTSMKFGSVIKENILFLHAFSGADTTSAFFRQGKLKFISLLEKHEELQDVVAVFKEPSAEPAKIAEVGKAFILQLYGTNECESLCELRYRCFAQSLNKSKFTLASLPPTDAAARFHSLRTYHQVQKWLGNDLPPTQWGWNVTTKGLVPITTDKDPAPPELLNIVSCKCLKGCMTATCTCRKAGLKCSVICVSCKGLSCSNSDIIVDEEDCDDPIDTTLENFLMPESEITHGIE